MDNCTLKKDIARRNFKKLATATITDSRRRVVDILDFKKQHVNIFLQDYNKAY